MMSEHLEIADPCKVDSDLHIGITADPSNPDLDLTYVLCRSTKSRYTSEHMHMDLDEFFWSTSYINVQY